ncbi:MAG: hypothetical protein HUJ98_10510 [Bacteroidaceae bacterium]|nr:hypothetical protein [Bacteroidaceae bacterium]
MLAGSSIILYSFDQTKALGTTTTIDAGYQKEVDKRSLWSTLEGWQEPVVRASLDGDTIDQYMPVKLLCDLLLDEDETYIDLMNHTLAYSLAGRENPVYVSQSPLQLAGDYTMDCFIEEISKNPDRNPIVMMSCFNGNEYNSLILDNIRNSYHYYRLFEYVYQNYRPLCSFGEFGVWCLNSRYDEMNAVVEAKGADTTYILFNHDGEEYEDYVKPMDYGYDRDESIRGTVADIREDFSFQEYPVGSIPLLWANNDKENAVKNPVQLNAVALSADTFSVEGVDTIDKSKGNYLRLSIDFAGDDASGFTDCDDEKTSAIVRIGRQVNGEFVENYRYVMDVKEGERDYLIRVSTDYFWYLNETDAIKVECQAPVRINCVQILQGD